MPVAKLYPIDWIYNIKTQKDPATVYTGSTTQDETSKTTERNLNCSFPYFFLFRATVKQKVINLN